jgi:L-lactate utilization protein LutB
MEERIKQVMAGLTKRKIVCSYAGNRREAAARLLDMIPDDSVVGIGGSMTVQELDIEEALRNKGCQVNWHWRVPKEEMEAARRRAMTADVYMCSANAVTEDGRIVNIDGTGNRVAATVYGPKKVFIVVGKNKIAGGLEEALRRIKEVACPQNARRLKKDTPCAATDSCNDCSSADRMCNVITIIEGTPSSLEMHVMLVGEDMGF